MATELDVQEEEIAKHVLDEVNTLRKNEHKSPISWKEAVKFCMARKFDKKRAFELYLSHEEVRTRERLYNINPFGDDVRSELLSGKFTILENKDSNGATIALFTARFHNPLAVSKTTTLQSLVLQLDAALDSITTQRNGLVFVYDMTDSKFSNFDYDLSIKILELLKGSFPARLKKVLIVLAPLWFKAPFKIMRLFVREKLRDRVHTIGDDELRDHLPNTALPMHLGGVYQVNHLVWLRRCLKFHRFQDQPVQHFFENSRQPSYVTTKYQQHAANITASLNQRNAYDMSHNRDPRLSATSPSQHRLSSTVPHANSNSNHLSKNSTHSLPPPSAHPQPPNARPPAQSSKPPPSSRPPPVPARNYGAEDTTFPPQRPDVIEGNILADIPNMGASWRDKDPFESVFPDGLTELLTPKEQLDKAVLNGKSGLVSEYMRLKNEPHQDTFTNARLPINTSKNRYSDVLCYDYTRVVLENQKVGLSNYINANHVNSFKQKRGYICCQGPLPQTFNDFWQMVWQEKVRTIVMTTKLMEKGRVKCGSYWPLDVNSMETYGDINVMNMDVEVEESEDFQVTTLCICNKNTGETRFIKHMLFLQWPDYGIPPCAEAFLHFVQNVREIQSKSVKEMPEWKGHPRGPPIVIHCSAGIGRSGTFICTDICMYLLDNIGKLNIKSVVKLIRTQRAFAIQMPDQYVFCHIAILQYAQQRGLLPADLNIPAMLEDDF